MLYGFLISLFVALCFLLILLILVQKGKSSLGLGSLGGGTQMLFGASGGQDLFQKVTWAMGTIFMVGSLGLALMKSSLMQTSHYLGSLQMPQYEQSMPAQPAEQAPAVPASENAA